MILNVFDPRAVDKEFIAYFLYVCVCTKPTQGHEL